jgi:hypothetical protein
MAWCARVLKSIGALVIAEFDVGRVTVTMRKKEKVISPFCGREIMIGCLGHDVARTGLKRF